jgi:sugar phosphate isomerase/epimerase
VTIAVENYYPELPILHGAVHGYSIWPSELAEQIAAVDHPAVGVCLDVGHAALAASAFDFDYLEECAAVAPLVGHLHLHDNLGKANLTYAPRSRSTMSTDWETCTCRQGEGLSRSRTCSNGWTSPKTSRAA